MTTSPVTVIHARISTALSESPIAVFRRNEFYDARFASTVQTQERIRGRDPDLIGVYHGPDGVESFREAIKGDRPPSPQGQ